MQRCNRLSPQTASNSAEICISSEQLIQTQLTQRCSKIIPSPQWQIRRCRVHTKKIMQRATSLRVPTRGPYFIYLFRAAHRFEMSVLALPGCCRCWSFCRRGAQKEGRGGKERDDQFNAPPLLRGSWPPSLFGQYTAIPKPNFSLLSPWATPFLPGWRNAGPSHRAHQRQPLHHTINPGDREAEEAASERRGEARRSDLHRSQIPGLIPGRDDVMLRGREKDRACAEHIERAQSAAKEVRPVEGSVSGGGGRSRCPPLARPPDPVLRATLPPSSEPPHPALQPRTGTRPRRPRQAFASRGSEKWGSPEVDSPIRRAPTQKSVPAMGLLPHPPPGQPWPGPQPAQPGPEVASPSQPGGPARARLLGSKPCIAAAPRLASPPSERARMDRRPGGARGAFAAHRRRRRLVPAAPRQPRPRAPLGSPPRSTAPADAAPSGWRQGLPLPQPERDCRRRQQQLQPSQPCAGARLARPPQPRARLL